MRILFIHQNFPGQFKSLAPALARRGDDVQAFRFGKSDDMPGVRIHRLASKYSSSSAHPLSIDFETKMIRAEATLQAADLLRKKGYAPDVIVAHPAWGESLFIKDVWPDARLGTYCEFFYRPFNADHDFDAEFAVTETPVEAVARTRVRNLPQRLHFEIADAGISPTQFQADTYPSEMRERITVIHDGIDTERVAPAVVPPIINIDGRPLTSDDEVITFVSRDLEPYRGLHIFLRALPELLRRRPKAQVIVVGADGKGYGPRCPDGGAWRHKFTRELPEPLDMTRVHFVGPLKYPTFLNLLKISTLHVYLTYPFVLSWSMLEAMSTGCAILASDVAPVREFITDGETGVLTDFFDVQALIERACTMLDDPDLRRHLGERARAKVIAEADLKTICLPRQLAWVDALGNAKARSGAPPA